MFVDGWGIMINLFHIIISISIRSKKSAVIGLINIRVYKIVWSSWNRSWDFVLFINKSIRPGPGSPIFSYFERNSREYANL